MMIKDREQLKRAIFAYDTLIEDCGNKGAGKKRKRELLLAKADAVRAYKSGVSIRGDNDDDTDTDDD